MATADSRLPRVQIGCIASPDGVRIVIVHGASVLGLALAKPSAPRAIDEATSDGGDPARR